VSNGKLFQTLGWVGVGVGAAAVVAGAALFVLMPGSGSGGDAPVGLMVTPTGSWVTVQAGGEPCSALRSSSRVAC